MVLVHLVGFIIKKCVTMHGHMSRCTVMLRCTVGHMNVKFVAECIEMEQRCT